MVSRFKNHLLQQLYILCRKETNSGTHFEIASHFKTLNLGSIAVKMPLKIKNLKKGKPILNCDVPLLPLVPDLIEEVTASYDKANKILLVKSNPQIVMKDILETDPTILSFQKQRKKIIVEYSSPNVSKPFHTGHLRSTIIGNIIANVKKKLGDDVVRINYLGDWGTQFGLLALGIKLAGYTDQNLKEDPIELLFEAYVKGNEECEKNPELREEALKIVAELENGNKDVLEQWNKIQEWTVDYLKNMYGRLGIHFDEYHWESCYKKKDVNEILEKIKKMGLLVTDDKNRICAKIDDKIIPLLKSDGSALYLARDLAAVYDRKSKYEFEQMYYVVENEQQDHFEKLFAICEKIGFDKTRKLNHVKFGKIQGLSTKTGNVDFIRDVFDEAKALQQEKLGNEIQNEEAADIVGISSVVINDLRQSRQKPYEFDWKTVFRFKGDTGVRLQFTYCRLHNLLEQHKNHIAEECYPKALKEEQAIKLICEISRYEENLIQSDLKLEPSILAHYLLRLALVTNEAYDALNINDADSHTASQRLLLFNCSKRVLEDGLKLLGLRALKNM